MSHGKQGLAGNDEVIGAAFKRSLLFVAALSLLAFLLWSVFSLSDRESATLEEDAPVRLEALLGDASEPSPPEAFFVDISKAAGLDFKHENGAYGARLLPETMGGGVAFLDYNNNGYQDLLFVNSDIWPHRRDATTSRPNGLRLYENDGHGRFREVTAEVGLEGMHFYGMGLAVGDYTGNGWTDIFATAVGENRLLKNEAGHFTDVTEQAGVAGSPESWSTSAAFFDYTGNGYLDLFVVNYVVWSRDIDLAVDYRLAGIGRAYGPPMNFSGTNSYLYRNNGDGSFTDVSEEAGIQVFNQATGEPVGKGLALIPVDLEGNGAIDLVVANDTTRNFLFRNRGDGSFEEVGSFWGLAFDRNGHATGAMGIDFARYRNDDEMGIAIGNFSNEMTSFYVARGERSQFADEAISLGIGGPTRLALTFGNFFFDYDLDGRLDYFQANGHVENDIHQVQPAQRYRQRAQLFWNCGDDCRRQFQELPHSAIGSMAEPVVGRGAAYADINGNGRLDVVITQIGGPALMLKNELETQNNWVRFKLEGQAPNTSAIGARLALTAGGQTQYRTVMPTRSYLSQVELPVTFGLGEADSIEQLSIQWPDGREQLLSDLAVNQLHIIRQP
jgi:enediyne biosynthesis protein E4